MPYKRTRGRNAVPDGGLSGRKGKKIIDQTDGSFLAEGPKEPSCLMNKCYEMRMNLRQHHAPAESTGSGREV